MPKSNPGSCLPLNSLSQSCFPETIKADPKLAIAPFHRQALDSCIRPKSFTLTPVSLDGRLPSYLGRLAPIFLPKPARGHDGSRRPRVVARRWGDGASAKPAKAPNATAIFFRKTVATGHWLLASVAWMDKNGLDSEGVTMEG